MQQHYSEEQQEQWLESIAMAHMWKIKSVQNHGNDELLPPDAELAPPGQIRWPKNSKCNNTKHDK
jgi:hypothetical protein